MTSVTSLPRTSGATAAAVPAPPAVAFVIPAHDEGPCLGATLDSLLDAARTALGGTPFEVVVVDDASTDDTAEVARRRGVRVVRSERQQIAAARNAGAAATMAPVLVFVDADTLVNAEAIRQALQAIAQGAMGGGALASFDGRVPRYARIGLELVVALFRLLQYTGGCFFFCRRDALLAAGGWDETYFASEEIWLARSLAREGRRRGLPWRRRFRIVRARVITSGRKVRTHSGWEVLGILLRLMWAGRRGLQSRRGLEFWYERRAENDGRES